MLLKFVIENIIFLALFTALVRCCTIGGTINAVFFYPKEYQQKAIERGLTTEEKINKHRKIFHRTFIPVMLIALIVIVGVINKADTFKNACLQSLLFLEIMNIYDGIVIDKIWVGHSKLWKIDNMEDLPYVQTWKQVLIKRSILAAIWIPLSAATAGLAILV